MKKPKKKTKAPRSTVELVHKLKKARTAIINAEDKGNGVLFAHVDFAYVAREIERAIRHLATAKAIAYRDGDLSADDVVDDEPTLGESIREASKIDMEIADLKGGEE